MLIEFRVSNFRSFAEEQCLSLVASADTDLEDANTVDVKAGNASLRLLRSAAIFGANASGKSNLVRAAGFLSRFLGTSIEARPPGSDTGAPAFLLDEKRAVEPCRFEVSFIHEGVRYQYTLTVDRQAVLEESLYAYPKNRRQMWFAREQRPGKEHGEWWFGTGLRGARDQLRKLTRPDVPFLSVAARFEHAQLRGVWNWFYWQLRSIERFSPLSRVTTQQAIGDPKSRALLLEFLRDADLGVIDWRVEQLEKAKNQLSLFSDDDIADHRVSLAHQRADGAPVWFDWKDESDGTKQFYNLIGPWQDSLRNGYVVFVDELDSSLHPALTRKLLSLFHDPKKNRKGAQLVFTGHDTTLLDPTLLRRDQIWFTEKDEAGRSRLIPLSDYSPRKGEALQKGYLAGRYGAVPLLGKFGV